MLKIKDYHLTQKIYESQKTLVYRGIREKDNLPIIAKLANTDLPTQTELEGYEYEYEMTQSLNLPSVVKTYALINIEHRFVLIEEDFGAISLTEYLRSHSLDVTHFLAIAIKITEGLESLHQHNIIHKDIKPRNILINPETKKVKINDFGIATPIKKETQAVLNPEQLEGTLSYMSPEQTGRMNRSIDFRTDFYSLGATFYEMLTGKCPFEITDQMALVHAHLARQPVPPCEMKSDIPKIISDIVLKLLAKAAEDRYQSAYGLKKDLEKCYQQWQSTGKIEAFTFEIGTQDIYNQFQIPEKLYGREKEVRILFDEFAKVAAGETRLVLVTGASGIGKSFLISEIHKPLVEQKGYFISGKFDQYQRNIPYSAIIQAFQGLIKPLLSESQEKLAEWKTELLAALEPNGQVIIDVIPELALIIKQQPPVSLLGAVESQNRFNLTFQKFIRVFTQAQHPLVIFIDDWQWADSASLSLLKVIMTDAESQYLLFLGTYRDNEVDETHPLMITLVRQEQYPKISSLLIKPLKLSHISQLVSDVLFCSATEGEPLAKLIEQKTLGNPFFVTQFLQALYQENLLQYKPDASRWQWNIMAVRAMEASDNVVELMVKRLRHLPPSTQAVLQLAACIGNTFNLKTLSLINQQPLDTLWQAIDEGFVLALDDNYKRLLTVNRLETIDSTFKFLHDRVQQAAYSLIADADKPSRHLQIGHLLKSNTSNIEKNLFEIVEHFNLGVVLIDNQAEKNEIAQLNLKAGQKAKAAAAYGAAFKHFKMGMALLGENSWQQQYDLSLALYVEAIEAAYLNGDFLQQETWAQEVLQRAQTLLDKVKVYEVQIAACQAQNKLLKAVKTGLEILKLLGITFPSSPNQADFMSALQETQSALAGKKIETLVDLPEMIEPSQLAAVRILSNVFSASYQSAPALMPLFVFKQVSLSVEYGNTAESAFAYANYGLILCAMVSDIDAGYQFAQLALNILARLNAKELRARTFVIINNLVRHWKEHVKETLAPLLEGYQDGLETGDLEWAAWCIVVHYYHAYFVGKKLPTLNKEMALYNDAIAQIKQETPLHWQKIYRQTVLNLIGRLSESPNTPPYMLMGESYNEEKMLPLHQQANDRTALSHFYLNKIILCYLFGEYAQAVEKASLAEKYLDGAIGLLVVPVFHFYDSLARLAISPTLDKVTANQKKMKLWAHHAP